MRKFYLIYSKDEIQQMPSVELEKYPLTSTGRRLLLSWSHYLKLMRISNINERHFYEIEAAKNNWSLPELDRQFDSVL